YNARLEQVIQAQPQSEKFKDLRKQLKNGDFNDDWQTYVYMKKYILKNEEEKNKENISSNSI
ncbi:8993_t:CDS:2, partial [Gigaspora margarita]